MVEGFTYKEVIDAYEDCVKNKKRSPNTIRFMYNRHVKLMELCDEINNRTYEIGKSIAFIVDKPVYREVFAADFRDRIVHHLVINELMPYFEKEFIKNTFSCMNGRGVLHGINTMYDCVKECTNDYTKDAWIVKLDFKSFFMNIVKQKLADMLDDFIVKHYEDKYKKETLRWLCNKIVMHHPELNCEKRGIISLWKKLDKGKSLFNVGSERGLAIGNLTSQIFANLYLNGMDHYIQDELGFKYYGRYVDDFIIISDDKEKLKKAVKLICKFAEEKLSMKIHPDKRYFQHYSKGVKFIGGVLKKGRKYIANRSKGALYYKLKTEFAEPSEDKLDDLISSVNSYLGYMRHFDSFNERKKILIDSGLLDKWKDYIIIHKKLIKITKVHKEKQNYKKIELITRHKK